MCQSQRRKLGRGSITDQRSINTVEVEIVQHTDFVATPEITRALVQKAANKLTLPGNQRDFSE